MRRTPTNVLHLRGSFERNPDRLREREGEPVGMPPISQEPPKALRKKAEQAAWREIVTTAPSGVLTRADTMMVTITAKLYARVLAGRGSVSDQRTLAVSLGKLGLNPADRSRVRVPTEEKPSNPFAELDE
jgi:hypothetical protein